MESIRERAAAALATARAETAVAIAERARCQQAEQAAGLKKLLFDRLGLTVTPTCGWLEVEGVMFCIVPANYQYNYHTRDDLHIAVTCPHCGVKVRNDSDITDWASLGRRLEEFDWPNDHRGGACRQSEDEPVTASPTAALTSADELRQALRRFLGMEEEA